MDVEKLKDMLRNAAGGPVAIQICQEAADALEQLQAENDRLRRERDEQCELYEAGDFAARQIAKEEKKND